MTFTMPVSSSSVRKITPFAVPGRWRTRTRPATQIRARFPTSSSRSFGTTWGGRGQRAGRPGGAAISMRTNIEQTAPPAKPASLGREPLTDRRGAVPVGIGHIGDRNAQPRAERPPAVAEPVQNQPVGRHLGQRRGGIGLVDAEDVVAVLRPGSERPVDRQVPYRGVIVGGLVIAQERVLVAR